MALIGQQTLNHQLSLFNDLISPESVAVIGASPDRTKIGNAVLENLVNQGFKGKIYPVNPSYEEILKIKCYPDILSVPGKVDLAVIALPAKIAPTVLEQCVKKEVSFVIIVAGGFSELGDEGRKLELSLKDKLKGTKTRLIGPNTVGVLFPHSNVNTALTPGDRIWFPKEGHIGFISQSGALGLLVMDAISGNGTGISGFVNIGNRADVDEEDLMEMFLDHEETKSIVAYLESIANGERFFKTLRRVNMEKPVVILKTGRTRESSAAASFHTGAMASDDRVMNGVLRQMGVVRAYNEVELIDFGKAFAYALPLQGKRIAVLTTAGGVGVLTTDLLTEENERPSLAMAKFSDEEIAELKKHALPIASLNNPIDLTADGSTEAYAAILEILSGSDNVDGIIAYSLPQTPKIDSSVVQHIITASKKKTTIVGIIGNRLTQDLMLEFEKNLIPAYPSIERTVASMKALYLRNTYMRRIVHEQ